MKMFNSLVVATGFAAAVLGFPLSSRDASDADIARLAPDLGAIAGQKPSGFGDCLSDNLNAAGEPIRVPCQCPPSRDKFIAALQANVHAGIAIKNPTVKVNFPTDDSKQSKLARITASSITLQNLDGPGKGCPIASTTLSKQAKAIEQGTDGAASTTGTNTTTTTKSNPPTAPTSTSRSSSAPVSTPASGPSDEDIARLVPEFGVKPGVKDSGSASCLGIVGPSGKPILIPCQCPPNRQDFIQSLIKNVRAKKVLNNPSVKIDSYPLDNSKNAKRARLSAAAVTLQNLNGPGKGCPIAATNWGALGKAIDNGTDEILFPPSKPSTSGSTKPATPSTSKTANPSSTQVASSPSNTSTPAKGVPSAADVARLAPDLGGVTGLNPTGTGDCDSSTTKNASGQPIKIPCSCPPSREVFVAALQANVAAGKALKNPSVSLTFPTGNSVNDKLARINAAAITVQNLNGPGKGCPIVSTTLSIQAEAIRSGKARR